MQTRRELRESLDRSSILQKFVVDSIFVEDCNWDAKISKKENCIYRDFFETKYSWQYDLIVWLL